MPIVHAANRGILVTSLGFVLVQLDVSIVNIALPSIGANLGAGVSGLAWVVDAYTVAFASFMLSAGALADRIGPRRVFLTGFTLFIAASLICGLAPGRMLLIIARALQGVGAAALVPSSLALLNHLAQGDRALRARAVGLWTAAGSVSLAAGPILGGVIIHWFGWRLIFLLNLPVGIAGLVAARRILREAPTRPAALDLPGQAFGILTLCTVTAAIIESKSVSVATTLGAIAALGAVAFLITEARRAHPMLPPAFFRTPAVSPALLVGFTVNLTLYGTIFLISLFFQQRAGYSPAGAGVAFLPFPLALLSANLSAGSLVARFGPRMPITLGLVLAATGFAMFFALSAATPWSFMLPGLILIPAGIGTAVPAMTTALLGAVAPAEAGLASGVLNTVRQSGGAIGVALFGVLFAASGANGTRFAFLLAVCLVLVTAAVAFWRIPGRGTRATAGSPPSYRPPAMAAAGNAPRAAPTSFDPAPAHTGLGRSR